MPKKNRKFGKGCDLLALKNSIYLADKTLAINDFEQWQEMPIFPEVLQALTGRTDHHVAGLQATWDNPNLDSRFLLIRRSEYWQTSFIVDMEQARVLACIWDAGNNQKGH